MRYACRLRGLPYLQFSLPSIQRNDKLPVVLNATEVKALLNVCGLLKHRLLIGICYGCGLRCAEVRTLTIAAEKPRTFLFEGNDGKAYSQRGAQWAISQAVKKAGIVKEVSLHTLRHTYATHLLEQGVNILTIKELLGHAHINTIMIYLHLARPSVQVAFSPLDTLYNRCK